MDTVPIGFFDSGLGGASVLREALRLLPNESYIYYGDDARTLWRPPPRKHRPLHYGEC